MTCWTYRKKFQISFMVMITLTLLLGIAKVFFGYKEKSLSLIADSFHLISDVPALIIGYLAFRFSNETVDGTYTFGRVRAEILGAMVNIVFLIAVCFSLTVESLKRLFVPDKIEHPEPVLIVGIIGLVVNAIGLILFRCSASDFRRESVKSNSDKQQFSFLIRTNRETLECPRYAAVKDKSSLAAKSFATPAIQLNVHGVFLHILQHVFVAIIVVTSALIVIHVEASWTQYVDPCLSFVVVIIVLSSSIPLLKECVMTLMQAVPANLQLQNMEDRLLQSVPEVIGVHEMHIWQLAGNQVVVSAHIVFQSHRMYNENAIKNIQDFFTKEGISSITIQPEFSELDTKASQEGSIDENCLLVCAGSKCEHLSCCTTTKKIIEKLQHQI